MSNILQTEWILESDVLALRVIGANEPVAFYKKSYTAREILSRKFNENSWDGNWCAGSFKKWAEDFITSDGKVALNFLSSHSGVRYVMPVNKKPLQEFLK